MAFVKLWDSILDNAKVQRLNSPIFKTWVNLLAVTARYGGERGELPSWEDMTFGLRVDRTSLEPQIKVLVTAGLIDKTKSHYSLHDFVKWNESKDKTRAKRQREWRHRNALRNAERNAVIVDGCNTPQGIEGYEGLEEEKKEEHPLTPSEGERARTALDPELERTAKVAGECTGDVSWEIWVHRQSAMGSTIPEIQEAIEVCVNEDKFDKRFAAGILRRLAGERNGKKGPA